MAEKYYRYSPYIYCVNDPINLIDPNGLYIEDPPSLGPKLRTVKFAIKHPIAAHRIGAGVSKGRNNISTNAVRFSTKGYILYGGNRNNREEDMGSENGAFRHALWQATIASEFGEEIAKEAGDAHEYNPNANIELSTFDNIIEADQIADLKNNIIGRTIGTNFSNKNMQELAILVLMEFRKNGLYIVIQNSEGYFEVKQTRLDNDKYTQLLDIFTGLNENARPKNNN